MRHGYGAGDPRRRRFRPDDVERLEADPFYQSLWARAAELERGKTQMTNPVSHATHRDAQRLANMEAALLARFRGERPQGAAASVFENLKLKDYAVLCDYAGWSAGRDSLLAAHSTSDFPHLLANVGEKRLLNHLRGLNTTYGKLALRASFRDFKPHRVVYDSGFPALQPVNEHGPLTCGTLEEAGETVVVSSYATILALSYEVLVNDDLGAFDAVFRSAAVRLAAHQNELYWALVMSNSGVGPTMSDGNPYFDNAHSNLLAAAALDETSLGLAVSALRSQTALDGTKLSLQPRFLVVAPSDEVVARKLLTTLDSDQGDELTLLVEPAIAGSGFYVFSDPRLHAGWIRGTLNDVAFPYLKARTGFEVDGLELKLRLDVGFGSGDWRAAIFTPAP